MSDKTERTKEEILKDIILVNTRLHSEDVILEMFTSIPPEGCKQIILAAMEEYRQSSPVESKWVSVKERPDTNCHVAVRTKNHTTEIMSYHAHPEEGREFYKWMFGRWVKQTHLVELWMFLFVHPPKPLPELPIEETKEK